MSEELKIIVDLLGQVSDNALYGVIIYMLLDFLKVPFILMIIGFIVNMVLKNIVVEKL